MGEARPMTAWLAAPVPCGYRAFSLVVVLLWLPLARPVTADAAPLELLGGRQLAASNSKTMQGVVTFFLSSAVNTSTVRSVMNNSLASYFKVGKSNVISCTVDDPTIRRLSERLLEQAPERQSTFQVAIPASQVDSATNLVKEPSKAQSGFSSVMEEELKAVPVSTAALQSYLMRAFSGALTSKPDASNPMALDGATTTATDVPPAAGRAATGAAGVGVTTTASTTTATATDVPPAAGRAATGAAGVGVTTTASTTTATASRAAKGAAGVGVTTTAATTTTTTIDDNSTDRGFWGDVGTSMKDTFSFNPSSWRFWLQVALVALPCLALAACCFQRVCGKKQNHKKNYVGYKKVTQSEELGQAEDTSCAVDDSRHTPFELEAPRDFRSAPVAASAVAQHQTSMQWAAPLLSDNALQQTAQPVWKPSWVTSVPRFVRQHLPSAYTQPAFTMPPSYGSYVQAPHSIMSYANHTVPFGGAPPATSSTLAPQPFVYLEDHGAGSAYHHSSVGSIGSTYHMSPVTAPSTMVLAPQTSVRHVDSSGLLHDLSPLTAPPAWTSSSLQPLTSSGVQPFTASAQQVLTSVQQQSLGTHDAS